MKLETFEINPVLNDNPVLSPIIKKPKEIPNNAKKNIDEPTNKCLVLAFFFNINLNTNPTIKPIKNFNTNVLIIVDGFDV